MRILQLCGFYEPSVGGIESYVKELSEKLVKRKNKVIVIARYLIGTKPKKKIEVKNGVKIYWVYSKTNTKISTLIAWIRAFFIALSLEFDIIHAHTIVPISGIAILLKAIRRKKVITTVHETHFHQGLKNPIYRFFARVILNYCDSIYCASQEIKIKIDKLGINKDVTYIGNAVDTKKFTPNKINNLRKQFNLSNEVKIIVSTRRLVQKDGVIYLIRAIPYILKETKNVFFCITGDGPDKKRVEEEINNLKVNKYVMLLGFVQNNKIPYLLNSADIFVLPSLIEATSISGLEAMSCGLPIVGTNVGGIPFLVSNGVNGYLCEPKKPKDLSKKLLMLLRSNNLKSFSKNSRQIVVENFSWETRVTQIEIIYKKLLQH